MPNSPSIGRASTSLPIADTHTPSSSPAAESGKPAGLPHAGPEADSKLGALANNNPSSAAGKGGRASFAAKVSSAASNAAATVSNAAQSAGANLAGRTGRLGAFSQGGGAFAQNAGALAQGAAPVVNGMTGMATAGMSVLGGVMQMEQAATMQIAEVMKQGARNVEEASKG